MGCSNSRSTVLPGDDSALKKTISADSKRQVDLKLPKQQKSNTKRNTSSQFDSFKDEGFEEEFADGSLGLSTEQNYQDILQSLEPNQLFEDPDFPADETALYIDPTTRRGSDITWLRPQVSLIYYRTSTMQSCNVNEPQMIRAKGYFGVSQGPFLRHRMSNALSIST